MWETGILHCSIKHDRCIQIDGLAVLDVHVYMTSLQGTSGIEEAQEVIYLTKLVLAVFTVEALGFTKCALS